MMMMITLIRKMVMIPIVMLMIFNVHSDKVRIGLLLKVINILREAVTIDRLGDHVHHNQHHHHHPHH